MGLGLGRRRGLAGLRVGFRRGARTEPLGIIRRGIFQSGSIPVRRARSPRAERDTSSGTMPDPPYRVPAAQAAAAEHEPDVRARLGRLRSTHAPPPLARTLVPAAVTAAGVLA